MVVLTAAPRAKILRRIVGADSISAFCGRMQAGGYGIRPYISANSMPAHALPPPAPPCSAGTGRPRRRLRQTSSSAGISGRWRAWLPRQGPRPRLSRRRLLRRGSTCETIIRSGQLVHRDRVEQRVGFAPRQKSVSDASSEEPMTLSARACSSTFLTSSRTAMIFATFR